MRYHVKYPFVKDMAKSEVIKAGTEIDESEIPAALLQSLIKGGFLVSTTDKKAQKHPPVQKMDLEAQIPQAPKPDMPKSVEPIDGTKVAEVKIPGIKDEPKAEAPQPIRRGRPNKN